jgi:hypothetical protein
MSYAQAMLEAYPRTFNLDTELVAETIQALYDCAEACTACADACLSESDPAALNKCIRLDMDCADQCQTAGRVLSRQTEYDANVTRAVLEACAQLCKTCGDACSSHAQNHEHCRICAEACRRCEDACHRVLKAIAD